MKVNLGCGQVYMQGWVNVDEDPTAKADIFLDAFDFVRDHGDEVEEVYMGHVLEHMLPGAARSLLALLCDRLPPGAVVSAVVPDMRAIFAAYERGEVSNDDLNARFVYSYVQPSHHLWCHDLDSLTALFQEAGFGDIEPIDPSEWEPVYWKEGDESRWQVGVRATAVGTSHGQPMADEDRARTRATTDVDGEAAAGPAAGPGAAGAEEHPPTVEEMLLERVHTLKEALANEAARVRGLEAAAHDADPAARLAYGSETGTGSLLRSGDVRAVAKRLLPEGTRRRVLASCMLATRRELLDTKGRLAQLWGRQAQLPTPPLSYRRWSKGHEVTDVELGHQVQGWRRTADPLRVAILVVSAGLDEPLERSLQAIGRQSWQSWEALVIIPKGSHGDLRPRFPDPRIRWVDSAEAESWDDVNRVVGHSNDPGFLVFLDAGDELAPDCLYQVASHARRDPLVDLVYWDDDLVRPDGSRDDPRFRPGWSPDTLLSANYIGRSFAIRPARFVLGGGAQRGRGRARLWEMLLRSQLDETRVSRVTRVLGHLHDRGDAVDGQGIEVVNAHLAEQGVPAEAELIDGRMRLRWRLDGLPGGAPRVTVVIPTRHNRPMVGRCLRSLVTTDYPSFDVVVIDNGDATAENEAWYGQFAAPDSGGGLDLAVHWWTDPFNYSAVNNLGASKASGDVLVFLNDDTEVLDPGWMTELVGWARQPGVGVVGLQLVDDTGALQHAGAILGLGGFADHVFQGMAPGDPSLLGPTTWYRNVLAVTGACLGIDRELFDEVGGFDERFVLCGSDVALGLDARLRGRRNLCSPLAGVRHFESVTRGTHIPPEDFFASYWRYQFWIFSGDPYFSPNLSLGSRVPRLRGRNEPSAADRLSVPLGRNFEAFRQRSDSGEAYMLAGTCRAAASDIRAVKALHASHAEPFPVRTVNWFLPDIDSPFYGGINTALRIANKLARDHGVENRFVVIGTGPEGFFRSALAAAFPALASSPIVFTDGSYVSVEAAPPADVSIATLWTTAYAVARFSGTRRKFYLVQDFEPMFYPAGTLYALAEQSYELGLYALGNTGNMLTLYRDTYGGKGMSFMPAVDPGVFHARTRPEPSPGAPVTVFVYARPGHWRNCWELASPALEEVKRRVGDRVRILTAGSWAVPEPEGLPPMRHLGLLDYRATGDLYRHCDIGLSLTVSKHPSYLPLELMACGAAVVAFDNSWGHWLLRDGENSLLALQTVAGLAGAIERLVVDEDLRLKLAAAGLATIKKSYGDWDSALSGIYPYLCDPEGIGPEGGAETDLPTRAQPGQGSDL